MADQADNLRQLIGGAAVSLPSAVAGPSIIVVTGGRVGVGATTVAVNLAAALADRAERVLVVDAAEGGGNLAEAAGIRPAEIEHSLSDVLAGKCTTAEAIVPGPGGSMLLANRCSRRSSRDLPRQAQQRLFTGLQSLRGDVDLVVIDIGSGLTPWTRRFWLRAQLVLLVTTTDASALLDCYATIKLSVADAMGPDLRLLVNECENDREAAEIHQRLSDSCRRFLARTVPALPALPRHTVIDGGAAQTPRVWEAPNTPFGHAALWLGRAVSDVLSTSASLSTESAAA